MAVYYDVGGGILKYRTERGWTANILERRAGLPEGVVSQYECGHREPKLRNLILLAHAFGVSLDELCQVRSRRRAAAAAN